MMCKTAQRERWAEQYVQGQLSFKLKDEFEIHLLECPKCLGEVETLNEIQFGLRARADDIREAEVVGRAWLRPWLAMVMLAIVVVAVGIWYFGG
jgi:hypothetical protein